MLDDVRRLLDRDGWPGAGAGDQRPPRATGIAELRAEIARRVRRQAGDPAPASRPTCGPWPAGSTRQCGTGKPRSLAPGRVAALDDAFAEAAGVPTVVDAVERSTRLRAGRATGWPVVAWLSRLRPDPLRRLHLDLGPQAQADHRPGPHVDAGGDPGAAGEGGHRGPRARRRRVGRAGPAVGGRGAPGLDLAASTTSATGSTPRSPPPTSASPGSRAGRASCGCCSGCCPGRAGRRGWTVVLAASGSLGDDSVPVGGVALPMVLLVGGVVLGIVLALVCRLLVAVTARSRAAAADRQLRDAVREVSHELVVTRSRRARGLRTVRTGLDAALGSSRAHAAAPATTLLTLTTVRRRRWCRGTGRGRRSPPSPRPRIARRRP